MRKVLVREKVKNAGFVSTRFKGTDGVSLETRKWVHVMAEMGLKSYFFAGQLDTPPKKSVAQPLADFQNPEIVDLYDRCFGRMTRDRNTTARLHQVKDRLKDSLYAFIDKFDIQLLVAENALTIPLNLPLGMALTELIAETGIKTIGHHHDFFWERKRFLVNAAWDYVNMAFPPHLPALHHAVINSSGANQLALRTGVSSTIIPNVMDFDEQPERPDEYALGLRRDLGLKEDDIFILQPTRVVQRKGIEHAIELADRLGEKTRLVISHGSGDEGHDYLKRVASYAETLGVELILAGEMVGPRRKQTGSGHKHYKLSDFYQCADLVTFPSSFEGFGNAFLEALYYRKPVLVNNYSVYATDIKPKGFRTIEIDDFITDEAVEFARKVLSDEDLRREIVEHNYDIARRYYSYSILRDKLNIILDNAFGHN
ncbi:MAG: glycosyltransferase family 4 protein [Candidatus Glassbacteria bacterium]|nr:glycosyltransferase family 4 protein [Candidatus Glassbacteria bacterium]